MHFQLFLISLLSVGAVVALPGVTPYPKLGTPELFARSAQSISYDGGPSTASKGCGTIKYADGIGQGLKGTSICYKTQAEIKSFMIRPGCKCWFFKTVTPTSLTHFPCRKQIPDCVGWAPGGNKGDMPQDGVEWYQCESQ